MKKLSVGLLALLPIFGFAQRNSETVSLNDGWFFSQTGKNSWYNGSRMRTGTLKRVLPSRQSN
jgi:hypothetical protein